MKVLIAFAEYLLQYFYALESVSSMSIVKYLFSNQNNNIMNKIFVTCRLGPDPKKSDPELITISCSSGRWFIFNGKFNFVSMIRWTR